MGKRLVLAVILIASVMLPLAGMTAEAGLKEELEKLIRAAIEEIPLEAGDLVAALGLRYSQLNGLVNVELRMKPLSLKKRAAKAEFVNWNTIHATAAFEFLGHYDLLVNQRLVHASDIKLIGEGAVNVSIKGFKVRIDDIPSLVLKLADRAAECPDIAQINRDPKEVKPGQSYRVSTRIKSNSRGHIAYFAFANNKAAQSADPTLRVVLGTRELDYAAPIVVRGDTAPDNYFGNVMAVEIVNSSGNPLDLKAYDALFSTGITMITVR